MPLDALTALGMAVVLNEVLYDPAGTDGGHEFVELLNVGDVDVRLDVLQVEVGDGARSAWSPAWQGGAGVLPPGAMLVIGGDAVPERAGELHVALQNGPDAVRLLASGAVVDLVGYGELTDPTLFEGRPAPDVSGTSLARVPDGTDTHDNHNDFAPRPPTPGRRNVALRNACVRLVEPAPERLWPLRRHVFIARLRNCGIAPLSLAEWSLRAELSRLVGEPWVDGVVRGTAHGLVADLERRELQPGDSLDVALRWTGELGLFELAVRLAGADEDTLDNHASTYVRVGAGPILVHEILYAPEAGGPEWIELWNRDARPHDVAGWTLADASGRTGRVAGATRLEPGGFAVVLEDTSGPRMPVPRALAAPWPNLNNTDGDAGFADLLVLRDTLGIVQDALLYSTRGGVAGRSLERVTHDPDVRGLVWSVCKHPDGSTPGAPNSSGTAGAGASAVELQPNPFSPDGDGHEDVLVVQITVPGGHTGFRAAVYDLDGRHRADLGGDRLGPGPRRFVWDGNGADGAVVSTGVYLLHFEFIGNPGQQGRRVIGVVRP